MSSRVAEQFDELTKSATKDTENSHFHSLKDENFQDTFDFRRFYTQAIKVNPKKHRYIINDDMMQ